MSQNSNFNSVERLVNMAYLDAKLIQEGDTPNSEQYANGINRLNDIINFWQTQGIKLWTVTDYSITLISGTAKYSLTNTQGTKPLRITDAYYLDTNNNRTPLWPLARADYTRLSNTTQPGAINNYFVDKQQNTLDVYFWMVPDAQAATGTAHVILQQQITNSINITDRMNFPQEWFLALRWGLADDLCIGQPTAIMQVCQAKATMYREALENWDIEDASVYFSPDVRGAMGRRV